MDLQNYRSKERKKETEKRKKKEKTKERLVTSLRIITKLHKAFKHWVLNASPWASWPRFSFEKKTSSFLKIKKQCFVGHCLFSSFFKLRFERTSQPACQPVSTEFINWLRNWFIHYRIPPPKGDPQNRSKNHQIGSIFQTLSASFFFLNNENQTKINQKQW